MKTIFTASLLISTLIAFGKKYNNSAPSPLCFMENKGQVTDGHGHARNDIQYVLHGNGINVFISAGKIHYQFESILKVTDATDAKENLSPQNNNSKSVATYRMDVTLVGADTCIEAMATGMRPYYEQYYIPGCGEGGCKAMAYSKITYPDIYPSIDWVLNIKDGRLEYEFVVKEGGDPTKIQLKYDGADRLRINEDGSVTAFTPMGQVHEALPVCYLADGSLTASRYLLNNNVLSYSIAEQHQELTIDPTVEWATYFGGFNNGSWASVACDKAGGVYMCGDQIPQSTVNIATTGCFQDTLGLGLRVAYLVKFDTTGNRLWATYYGGALAFPPLVTSGDTYALGMVCDGNNNVYISGSTVCDSGIATPGSHQPVFGGGTDAFLVKFNSAGTRQWATYYGGLGSERGEALAMDNAGYLYMAGHAGSTTNIATPGAYKTVYTDGIGGLDAFLVKFDTLGVRQWGTYYGGLQQEIGYAVCTDAENNVYMAGTTQSTDSIATPGSHQPVFGGGYEDAFIVKFNLAGALQWGTYYGGSGTEEGYGLAAYGGNVYLSGYTQSINGIATPGSHQPVYGGGADDAFLVGFNSAGVRQWGTYYGGDSDESPQWFGQARIAADDSGYIYISGVTSSRAAIATPYSYQEHYGGGLYDAFLAKFNPAGARQWGTYYGDCGNDVAYSCAADGFDHVYLAGFANSLTGITTPGSFQPVADTNGWSTQHFYYFDPFLAKFNINDSYGIIGDTVLCGSSGIYSVPAIPGATSYTWLLPAGLTGSSTSDSITVTGTGAGGNIQVIVNKGCSSDTEQAFHISVYPPVVATIAQTGNILNTTTTFTAYQWYLDGTAISGATSQYYTMMASGNYYVTVTQHGCSANSDTVTFAEGIKVLPGNSGVRIFPNPVNDEMVVENAIGSEVRIYNVTGQEVYNAFINSERQAINTSSLVSGVYIVQIVGNDGYRLLQRLVKE